MFNGNTQDKPNPLNALSLHRLVSSILTRRNCKQIVDARFFALKSLLRDNLRGFNSYFLHSADMATALELNFNRQNNRVNSYRQMCEKTISSKGLLIDKKLCLIVGQLEALFSDTELLSENTAPIVRLINEYNRVCSELFDNRTLVFFRNERLTESGYFGGVFWLNCYLDDAEFEMFRMVALCQLNLPQIQINPPDTIEKIYQIFEIPRENDARNLEPVPVTHQLSSAAVYYLKITLNLSKWISLLESARVDDDVYTSAEIPFLFSNSLALLDFGNFQLGQIDPDLLTFDLCELRLSKNQIKSLPDNLIHPNNALTILDLSHNQLKSINANTFSTLKNLRHLDLSSNNLVQIELDHLTSLKHVRLDSNKLAQITCHTFAQNTKLETLSIVENGIFKIDDEAFANQRQLRQLILEQNEISEISSSTLHGLTSLSILKLADNKIDQIDSNSLKNTPRLKYLDLSSNCLTKIDDGLFSYLNTNLKVLKLDSNFIKKIDDQAFFHLRMLNYLDLSNNNLYIIKSAHLARLSLVEQLDLSLNSIEKIEPDSFGNLRFLRSLNLRENRLRDFRLEGLRSGVSIELAFNEMSKEVVYRLEAEALAKCFTLNLTGNKAENESSSETWSRISDRISRNRAHQDLIRQDGVIAEIVRQVSPEPRQQSENEVWPKPNNADIEIVSIETPKFATRCRFDTIDSYYAPSNESSLERVSEMDERLTWFQRVKNKFKSNEGQEKKRRVSFFHKYVSCCVSARSSGRQRNLAVSDSFIV